MLSYLRLFIATVFAFSLLAGCGKDEVSPIVSASASVALICDYENALQEGVTGISKRDAQAICRAMRAKLMHDPSAKLLATMQKFLFGLRANYALKETAKDFTEQAMAVIEGRRQLESPDADIIQTLNASAKCYSGSQGRVTLLDLASALQASGEAAATMNEQGFYSLCAMIEVMNQ